MNKIITRNIFKKNFTISGYYKVGKKTVNKWAVGCRTVVDEKVRLKNNYIFLFDRIYKSYIYDIVLIFSFFYS
jgi:hypothetical protein